MWWSRSAQRQHPSSTTGSTRGRPRLTPTPNMDMVFTVLPELLATPVLWVTLESLAMLELWATLELSATLVLLATLLLLLLSPLCAML